MISNYQWLWWSEVTANLTLVLLTFPAIGLAFLWYRSRTDISSLPPGPRGLPLAGYLPFLGPNLHHEFTKIAQRYGPIFKLNLGSKTHIVISSSDLAKVVLREQDDIFANRDPPVAALAITYGGQDILWSNNNSYWRNLRKVFASEVLSNKNLEASSFFRQREVRKTIKHLYTTMGTEVDIGRITFLTTLSLITSMLWGRSWVEDEITSDIGREFREVISKIVELYGTANVSDFFPMLSRFDLQGVEREMKRQLKTMDGIFEKIIEERMAIKPEVGEQQGRKDFLQILLELKDQNTASSLNITQIKALLMDMIIGGTDTTSTMVEWTMAELLQNPEVLRKVQDELEDVVGRNNIVEQTHIPELRYLDAAIKETFRLHPALPLLVARSPNKTCKVGTYVIPKGSNVYVNVWSMHMDPQYWDNPSEFNLNRFLSFDGTKRSDYNGYNCNYLPFGSGRRICPGASLGEKMLVYLLASLLHSFDWSLPCAEEHEMSDKFGIILKKRKPLVVIPSQRLSDTNLYM